MPYLVNPVKQSRVEVLQAMTEKRIHTLPHSTYGSSTAPTSVLSD